VTLSAVDPPPSSIPSGGG
jgi:hypothetical protein